MADNDLNTSSPGEEEYEVEAISDHGVDKKGNRKVCLLRTFFFFSLISNII